MKDIIKHDGIVSSIEGNHIVVRIVQQAACSECKAKAMCTSSESKDKYIDVYDARAAEIHKIGDAVTVCGTLGMGKKAVRMAFGIPLALIVLAIVLGLAVFGIGEPASVALAAVAVGVYFWMIRSFGGNISKEFAFWIE